VEQLAKSLNGYEVYTGRGLVIEQSDGVAMKAGFPRHIGNLQLPFTHYSGEVALDHEMLNQKKSVRMT